ncbi:hypothetical protein NEDG_00987 [Nematocida displodere]|uniref:Uncharacterized protein n=1 Tax=Nematocida displodere TaxID=1805483 RepID=A0A177EAN5_9MICR|nr:hypothetical protein NEDG_00987 [Nematocida displodere]
MMNTAQTEEDSPPRHNSTPKEHTFETKKDALPLKEKVETLEKQIKQTINEYERLSDIVEKLKIINTLLYKEVCKEYTAIKNTAADEEHHH